MKEQSFLKRKLPNICSHSPTATEKAKQNFFLRFGFSVDAWEIMATALLRHAADHELAKIEESPFGTRYVIEGEMLAADGRKPFVRSVWFIETGGDTPRLVSAYPPD